MSEAPQEEEAPDFGNEGEKENDGDAPKGVSAVEIDDSGDEGPGQPSYTLHIIGAPESVETSELKTRLERHGTVVSVDKDDGGMIVCKFSRTTEAYEAREKLDGITLDGKKVKVKFGPQDPEHYNRGYIKKGQQPPVEKKAGRDGRRESQANGLTDLLGDAKASDAGAKETEAFHLGAPEKPVSTWSPDKSFESQLEDFMKMDRKGMYNRYLVFGKLPVELRTADAIRRMVPPAQRDIQRIEMIKCFGKPCAHISLRSAAAALSLHRHAEQHKKGLTVAFAPPRRQSSTLWLGNIDDFVDKEELQKLLREHGQLVGGYSRDRGEGGIRYLPQKTCAFATFKDASQATAARNHLYGLEVQPGRYLNIDFVDEQENLPADDMNGWGPPPGWMPGPGIPPPPWLMPPGKGMGGKGKWGKDFMPPWMKGGPPPGWDERRRGRDDRFGRDDDWKGKGRRGDDRSPPRRKSRSRSRKRRRNEPEESPPPPRERTKRTRAAPAAPAQEAPRKRRRKEPKGGPVKEAPGSDEEAADEPGPIATGKSKVKLFKMGEFVCNCVATYVQGMEDAEPLVAHLQIDQRTKVDHCKSHMDKAGNLATTWHFSAADRRDCAAYDALCDYFVEKERVGLVQTPSYYVYVIPPTKEYLDGLQLPESNFVVGLQIPVKK